MSDYLPRRGMSPEALCNALDIAARTFRRIIFQAIDGQNVRADLAAARRELGGLLDYATILVENFGGPDTFEEPSYTESTEG